MAVIGKIRNRMGILMVIFVGGALLAFILGDFLTSGAYFFNSEQNTVGEFDGEAIKGDQFSNDLNKLERYYQTLNPELEFTEEIRKSIEEQLWSEYQYKYVFAPRLSSLGITVSDEELKDAFSGRFMDPNVRQQFTDPNTGMFSYQALEQTINQFLDESVVPEDQLEDWKIRREQWNKFEDQVAQNRALTKYATMIEKGLQVTSAEMKSQFIDDGTNYSFRFIAKNYFEIPDSAITLTDADYKASFAKHKNRFKNTEATRYVKYGIFRIIPSSKDSAAALAAITELKGAFAESENDTSFVNEFSDIRRDPSYFKKGGVSLAIDSVIFAASNGTVFGPYLDGNMYTLAKKVSERSMPDSAKARMIFIASVGTDGSPIEGAKEKADSLLAVVKAGKSIKELAAEVNDDPSLKADSGFIQPGGWISWELATQAPIFDSIFSAPVNALKLIDLSTGYAILKVEEKTTFNKQVKIAYVQKEITADDGQSIAFAQANDFIVEAKTPEDFDRLQKTGKYLVREDLLRESSTGLTAIDNSRKMIYWAFTNKAGAISELELIGNNYIVATVINARNANEVELKTLKGDPSFESLVRRDKKAAMLKEQMAAANGANLDAVAAALNAPVMSSGVVNINSYSVPGVGNDPAILGAAAGAPVNKVYGPIEGRSGVYMISVESRNIGTAPPAFEPSMKRQFATMLAQKVMSGLQGVIIEDAKVRDMRYKMHQ